MTPPLSRGSDKKFGATALFQHKIELVVANPADCLDNWLFIPVTDVYKAWAGSAAQIPPIVPHVSLSVTCKMRAVDDGFEALLEPFYNGKGLTDPISTVEDKFQLLPAFLKVKGQFCRTRMLQFSADVSQVL